MKKEEDTNSIRLGNGVWNFEDFYPREEKTSEDKEDTENKEKPFKDDPFTNAFLYLHQALQKHEQEQKPENETEKSRPYYLLHPKEQQGIFTLNNRQISLGEIPLYLIGPQASEQQRNYLYYYCSELRQYLEETVAVHLKPLSSYYGLALVQDGRKNRYGKVNLGAYMNLENTFHATLFPLEEKHALQRIAYQLFSKDKEKVLSAGFFYCSKEKTIDRHEVKAFSFA